LGNTNIKNATDSADKIAESLNGNPELAQFWDSLKDREDLKLLFKQTRDIAFNIPADTLGFVYLSRRQNYHLILNGNINYETQCNVFLHEVKHITEDMPTMGYIIGLDMQYTYMELSADNVANKLYSIK
jgi:hypothetical protein